MSIQSESLEQRLNRHPELKVKIEILLSVGENAEGDLVRADDAEQRGVIKSESRTQAALGQ